MKKNRMPITKKLDMIDTSLEGKVMEIFWISINVEKPKGIKHIIKNDRVPENV
jgi:hypothetical protein